MAKRREKGKIPHTEWPEIRTRYAAGESLASIARNYGCTGPAIRYIVNRPAQADGAPDAGPLPALPASPATPPPETAKRAEAAGAGPVGKSEAPAITQAAAPQAVPSDRPGTGAGTIRIDTDLRWRVSSEIASFLTVFDSFLMEGSSETYDDLLGATDRLMRVAARIRIELERSRMAQPSEQDPPPRPTARRARSQVG